MFPEVCKFLSRAGINLSGGQKKMVSIARAIALAPSLMILDEAFEGLAPVIVKRFREAVLTIKGVGISLLLAESNLTSAAAIADRIYVIDRGEIVFHGSPRRPWRTRKSCGCCGDDEAYDRLFCWPGSLAMKRIGIFAVVLCAFAAVPLAWGGHELPVYPSFYPHEIEIRTLPADHASRALLDAKIQAYIGRGPRFPGALAAIETVESLGSFVMVRVNPQSPLNKDEQSVCAAVR